jgi:Cu2+-exporting ATPase
MVVSCDHCLLPFPEREAIRDEIGGKKKVFCCIGCRGIYRVIHEEGLDEFYERRSGWKPGPLEDVPVAIDLFRDSVRYTGDEAEMDISLSGIRCASCIWLIEHSLSRLQGINEARVNYATHRARIRWDPKSVTLDTILKRIKSLGYMSRPYAVSALDEHLREEKRDLLIRFGTAAFFSMQLMLYTTALYAGYFQGIDSFHKKIFELIALALATPVMFYCGYPFLKGAIRAALNRTFSMDTLVFLGSFSAYFYSVIAILVGGEVYFDTSAMIITLILLGRFVETGAKAKASGAVSALIRLQPKEAKLAGNGEGAGSRVPVSSLAIGDRIEVIPGEKIPVDCIVVKGSSELDESMLTGEATPLMKTEGAQVFAGTMNLNGGLVLEVTRVGNETALARIIAVIEEAQARKAPVQKTADRVVGLFVPVVILIAAATFAFRLALGSGMTFSLMTAVSVLVIACPCALGLATPLTVLIGSTLLASRGILAKGGDIFESVARSDSVIFDKTGTLTTGTPTLTNVLAYDIDERKLRVLAASIERHSEHTVSKALRAGISDSDLHPVTSFRAHPGRGVEGRRDDELLLAGNTSFLESRSVKITEGQRKDLVSLSSKGDTIIGLAVGSELKGWFVISDDLRQGAREVVAALKRRGCTVGLITGDHRTAAEEIGKRTGISMINAEVLPAQKAAKVREMKEAGHRVVMVGDGINDAPALIEADAGVAMVSATDVAMESADVVLMRNDLSLVPRLMEICGKSLSVIRQNLWWAFSYNIVAIPLAVSGKLHPIVAAAFMAMSSLMVVGNSLRLYREK